MAIMMGSGQARPALVNSLCNLRTGHVLAQHLVTAGSFWQRGIGLLGRHALEEGEGLYIAPCSSVHSFFMRFSFDAVFVDRDWKVIHLIPAMPAFRLTRSVRGAHGVVELPSGVIAKTGTALHDVLAMQPYGKAHVGQ